MHHVVFDTIAIPLLPLGTYTASTRRIVCVSARVCVCACVCLCVFVSRARRLTAGEGRGTTYVQLKQRPIGPEEEVAAAVRGRPKAVAPRGGAGPGVMAALAGMMPPPLVAGLANLMPAAVGWNGPFHPTAEEMRQARHRYGHHVPRRPQQRRPAAAGAAGAYAAGAPAAAAARGGVVHGQHGMHVPMPPPPGALPPPLGEIAARHARHLVPPPPYRPPRAVNVGAARAVAPAVDAGVGAGTAAEPVVLDAPPPYRPPHPPRGNNANNPAPVIVVDLL
jgi:hypothetical protein